MKKNTRFAFNAYLQQLARLNGVAVEELSSKFTVEPSVQQTLEDQIQQSAAFLTLINVTPVTEQSGQLLGLGVGSTIAGTTDTTAKEREPVDPTLMVDVEYKCEQTNFDTVLTYAKLDLWAKFQDFQVRIRDAIVKRQALDRIMIGFNGVKRAKTSNRSENPLLQDVNKGCRQFRRSTQSCMSFADVSRCWDMPRWQRFRRNSWTAKVSAFITISTRFTAGHAPCSTSVIRTMTPRHPV